MTRVLLRSRLSKRFSLVSRHPFKPLPWLTFLCLLWIILYINFSAPLLPYHNEVLPETPTNRQQPAISEPQTPISAIYVIHSPQCHPILNRNNNNDPTSSLPIALPAAYPTPVFFPRYPSAQLSLTSPPIPIVNLALQTKVTSAKVAELYTYIKLLRKMYYHRQDISLILDSSKLDGFMPKVTREEKDLREVVGVVDRIAVEEREPWHVIFIRRRREVGVKKWKGDTIGGDVGHKWKLRRWVGENVDENGEQDGREDELSVFVVSIEGVNYLLSRIVSYEASLMERLRQLSREGDRQDISTRGENEKLVAWQIETEFEEPPSSSDCERDSIKHNDVEVLTAESFASIQ